MMMMMFQGPFQSLAFRDSMKLLRCQSVLVCISFKVCQSARSEYGESEFIFLFLILFVTGEPVEYNVEQSTETSQAEGEMQLLQQMEQIRNKRIGQSKRRGLSKFWRRY